METISRFIQDETGFSEARIPAKWARFAVVLLVLNEVRGLIVAGTIVAQIWG
jgi:hypothetical protein